MFDNLILTFFWVWLFEFEGQQTRNWWLRPYSSKPNNQMMISHLQPDHNHYVMEKIKSNWFTSLESLITLIDIQKIVYMKSIHKMMKNQEIIIRNIQLIKQKTMKNDV